jgi:glucose-6-phosphate-specific signal transduction histidine kinase
MIIINYGPEKLPTVGAYSETVNSFLLAFTGAIILTGVTIIVFNRLINARKIRALEEKKSRS